MKNSTVKKVVAAILVITLLVCTAPVAFAEDAPALDDIRENPVFQGALMDMLASFARAFVETITRYIQVIAEFINNSGIIAPQ